jgi:hypothetical protein
MDEGGARHDSARQMTEGSEGENPPPPPLPWRPQKGRAEPQ